MSEQQPQQDPQASTSSSRGVISIIIAVILMVVLAVVLWRWSGSESPQPDPPRTPVHVSPQAPEPEPEPQPEPEPEPEPEPVVMPEPEPAPEPEPEVELPALNESTEVVLDEAREQDLNTRPIRSNHLIRDLVVFVHNLSDGAVIRESATVAPPDARFSTQTVDNQLYIDERTYDRYNELVDWFVSLDSERLVLMYQQYEPLFSQAFAEIAHPDERFRSELIEAIDVLLATPEPEGLLALSDERVMYTFADPELEDLPAAQKQMLRLGLDNQRRVKRKLREIRALLDTQS